MRTFLELEVGASRPKQKKQQQVMNDVSSQPKVVQALYNFQPANTDEVWIGL